MNLDTLISLVGDIPVSEQISMALQYVSEKGHEHTKYADRNEVEDLKKKVELLLSLVGDTSVSDQIEMAINNIK